MFLKERPGIAPGLFSFGSDSSGDFLHSFKSLDSICHDAAKFEERWRRIAVSINLAEGAAEG